MRTTDLPRPRRPRRGDDGFTLVELVIAVSILGIVMSAVCAAMLVALKTNKETSQRLGKSNDLQYAATWFAEDIASANAVTTNATAVCGAAVTALLNLTSTDIDTTAGIPATPPPSPEPTTRSVSYVLITQSTADGIFRVLERRGCGAGSTTPTTVDRIAQRLSTSVAPVVVTTAAPTISLELTSGDDGQSFTLYGTQRRSS